ncbi:MAG: alpha/beta hydrolase [Alphaproteobacteria bacterium]|nr:alpha/beta hydrolase [Alphaproteobacteria bacterium]
MRVNRLICWAALAYLGAMAGVFAFQRSFIYVPNQTYAAPEQVSPETPLKELAVTTKDGLNLVGWYAPASGKDYTLVYFHGNADSLQSVWPLAGPYLDAGYGFLFVEYRGYSNLPGDPDEEGFYEDARAFVKKLISDEGVKEKDIVLMGHSLGTGVAMQMASEFKVRGVALLAPFLSMPDMAQERFPWLPARYLTLDKFDNAAKVSKIKMPLLVGVCGADNVVPAKQEQKLFEMAKEPKKLFYAPESGHSGLFENGFYQASIEWLESLPYLSE